MEKYALFRGTQATGAPNVHLIEPGSMYGLGSTADLCKTASKEHLPEVMELVESLQPQPDRLYLLNSALGAGEHVGFNMRGDWFTEKGLLHTPEGWDKIAVWDIDGRRQAANQTEHIDGWGNLAWGFPTFMNAHRFRHHVNKDPNRAYGYVLGAFWDPRMHRVVLVTELIRSLCEQLGALHIYDRIANGEFPDTSMGAKVPYDRCSICGHIARTPAEYCMHVKAGAPAPYGMNALLPDGRRCGVYNDYPRFFDDSLVFVGAERSAKIMTNLTDQVSGDKPYSQKIYSFGSGMKVAAAPMRPTENAPADGVTSTSDSQPPMATDRPLSRLAIAIRRAQQERNPKDGGDSADRLTQVLDRVRPSDTSEEKEILKLLSKKPGQAKSASLKWAEILKRIPSPGPGERAIVAAYERRTKTIPEEQLIALATDPHSAMMKGAELGIVFTPEEFQYITLYGVAPKTASALHRANLVFAPAPINESASVDFRVHAKTAAAPETLQALNDMFWERSFAPVAVLGRIDADYSRSTIYKAATAVEFPGSDVLAEFYNDYRGGLLAQPPNWRYVTGGQRALPSLTTEAKLASTAQGVSQGLLLLAFWPSLSIG